MAIHILARDFSAEGTWQVDYDDVAHTVGHTCDTSSDTATLVLTVIRVSDQASFTKDVSGDFGRGRIVDLAGVPTSEVPPIVKGVPSPFLFSGTWTP